jgi:hypothetical protein
MHRDLQLVHKHLLSWYGACARPPDFPGRFFLASIVVPLPRTCLASRSSAAIGDLRRIARLADRNGPASRQSSHAAGHAHALGRVVRQQPAERAGGGARAYTQTHRRRRGTARRGSGWPTCPPTGDRDRASGSPVGWPSLGCAEARVARGDTHMAFLPRELLEQLCGLVPPRMNLVRDPGALVTGARLRRARPSSARSERSPSRFPS